MVSVIPVSLYVIPIKNVKVPKNGISDKQKCMHIFKLLKENKSIFLLLAAVGLFHIYRLNNYNFIYMYIKSNKPKNRALGVRVGAHFTHPFPGSGTRKIRCKTSFFIWKFDKTSVFKLPVVWEHSF